MPRLLRKSFFDRSVHEVAPELIGATLLFKGVGGVIVEVEAYHHTDPAAHSYGGQTARNAVMFGPAGLCLCLPLLRHPLVRELRLRGRGLGERGADPRAGADRRAGRDAAPPPHRRSAAAVLRSGPAHRGARHHACAQRARARCAAVRTARAHGRREIVAGPRIGITKAVELPWRYGLAGSRFLKQSRSERESAVAKPSRDPVRTTCE